jgi:hypothetical protein
MHNNNLIIILAKERSVTQVLVNVIGIAGGVIRLSGQFTNPFQNLLCVLFTVLAVDLSGKGEQK